MTESPTATRPHAVVTGGGRGIGRTIALRLATQGHNVTVMGRNQDALDSTADEADGIRTRICDVSDAASIAKAFDGLGPVDVLVNNAGIASSAPVMKITVDEWERIHRVNATGVLLCVQEVLTGMRSRDKGRIVTVASLASHQGERYIAAYVASKHAVIGLMRSLAAELAGTGVTANTVCPGYVRSPMTDRTIANIVDKTGRSPDGALTELLRGSRLGRLIEPEEVAAAVVYLASDAAGAVNGQSIVIDGGNLQQ